MAIYFINYAANKNMYIHINLNGKMHRLNKIDVKTHDETIPNLVKRRFEERNTGENINFAWKNQVVGRYNVSRQDYTPAGFEW